MTLRGLLAGLAVPMMLAAAVPGAELPPGGAPGGHPIRGTPSEYQAAVRRSNAHFGTYAIDSAEAGPGAVGEVEWERGQVMRRGGRAG